MAVRGIPESIKQYRPESCTEIKRISDRYYVYRYVSIKLSSGKWGKKTGKCIGSIIPEKGFVPNKNYKNEEDADRIVITEYGQYALIEQIAHEIKEHLLECFTEEKASQIFAYAVLLFANGLLHIDQVQTCYEQSWLSVEYQKYSFKMGRTAINSLLDDLGRRATRVRRYERLAIARSSASIAVDGHAIRSCSCGNNLAENGSKFKSLNGAQVNLLMGYDTKTEMPVFARIYRGSCNDKSTIKDLAELYQFRNILFIVDRGFYSRQNLDVFSENGNTYIIPIPANTNVFCESIQNVQYKQSFYYSASHKHNRIEYSERKVSEHEMVYIYRDIEENEKCRFNYLHSIELGVNGYTQENLEKNKELFGVYVIQTNTGKTAEETFKCYKRRWTIETFYQYIKNGNDFNGLMLQDYYKEQGFAFIMLITGQIHQKVIQALKTLKNNTFSIQDVLLMARFLKMELRNDTWNLMNLRKKDMMIMSKMGFVPQLKVASS